MKQVKALNRPSPGKEKYGVVVGGLISKHHTFEQAEKRADQCISRAVDIVDLEKEVIIKEKGY
jgi:hypothetical protein